MVKIQSECLSRNRKLHYGRVKKCGFSRFNIKIRNAKLPIDKDKSPKYNLNVLKNDNRNLQPDY
jgi:hypothetical protein